MQTLSLSLGGTRAVSCMRICSKFAFRCRLAPATFSIISTSALVFFTVSRFDPATMAPKAVVGKTQKKVAQKGNGKGGKKGKKVVQKDSEEDKGSRLPAMEAKALKELCGTLAYHGIQKKNPDPDVKKLYEMFHSSNPEQKRALLQKFKNKSGKVVSWAKEVVSSTVITDDETHGTVADFYNRNVYFSGFKFPRISGFLLFYFLWGPHRLNKQMPP